MKAWGRGVLRWIVVVGTLLIPLVLVVMMSDYQAEGVAEDEILAYELAADAPLRARVPGGVSEALVTTWALIPEQERWDPEETFQYSYQVERLRESQPPLRQSLDIVSRISADPRRSPSRDEFSARLASGSDWVTDARTSVIDLSAFRGRGGTLRIAPRTSDTPILLRVLYRQPRSDAEQRVLASTLTPEERRRLTLGRSSLGFADLSAAARSEALATWGRRVVAEGREGVDYFTRRLLLGSYSYRASERNKPLPSYTLSDEHRVALTFVGDFELAIHGRPGAELEARVMGGAMHPEGRELALSVNAAGQAIVSGAGDAMTSVLVGAVGEEVVSFSLPADQHAAQFGQTKTIRRPDGRLAISVDDRVQRFWRLDLHQALRFGVDPSMPYLQLVVRELRAGQALRRASLLVTFQKDERVLRQTRLSVTSQASPFERTEQGQVTSEARTIRLGPPPGADSVVLTGSPALLAKLQTSEPGVEASVIDPAYQHAVPEGFRLRYAPFFVKNWVNLRPISPQGDEQEVRVVTQVRLEPQERLHASIEERGVSIAGPVRWLDLPSTSGGPGEWLELASGQRYEISTARRQLDCRYWVDRPALGRSARLWVDGRTEEKRLTFPSGAWLIPTESKQVHVSSGGLGEPHVLLCRGAGSVASGQLMRRRVFGASAGSTLTLQRRAGELLSVLVYIVHEEAARGMSLRYQVDGGEPRRRAVFSRRQTTAAATIEPSSSKAARLWRVAQPVEPSFDERLSKFRIRLGDDLSEGTHTVSLWPVQDGRQLTSWWGRAVLVGQVDESEEVRIDEP